MQRGGAPTPPPRGFPRPSLHDVGRRSPGARTTTEEFLRLEHHGIRRSSPAERDIGRRSPAARTDQELPRQSLLDIRRSPALRFPNLPEQPSRRSSSDLGIRRSSLVDLEVALLEDDAAMSSDSGSSPTRCGAAPASDTAASRRRSSYDNAPSQPLHHQRPPSCPTVRRSTPSPSRKSSGDEGASVRRRPASACGRAPRRSMPPPPECHSATWGGGAAHHQYAAHPHHGCCGGAAPPHQPYHWCGSPQTWGHYHHHQVSEQAHREPQICLNRFYLFFYF